MTKITLSESEKKRIKEEEAYRAKLRDQLEQNSKSQKKSFFRFKFREFLILLVLLGIVGLMWSAFIDSQISDETRDDIQQRQRRDFEVGVTFTGSQFEIANVDNLDCQDAQMTVNDDYTYEGDTLLAGETHTIGAMQFAKKDGTRLNPFEIKPQNFFIYCRGSNSLSGASYFGEW